MGSGADAVSSVEDAMGSHSDKFPVENVVIRRHHHEVCGAQLCLGEFRGNRTRRELLFRHMGIDGVYVRPKGSHAEYA